MEKVTKERAALALMRWVPDRRAASLRLSGMTVGRRDLLVSQGLTSWTYRRRRFCKAPRRPLGFPGYPEPQPHPPVLPDKCGNAERRSGIQTLSAPEARSFPIEKVTEVRALLALMRWVPDRRAALLRLSGMTVRRRGYGRLAASGFHRHCRARPCNPCRVCSTIEASVLGSVRAWIPWSSHGMTTKQGDAINPSLVIPVRGAFEYPLAGGSLYRPGRPLFFGRPRLRFSSAGSS